MRALEDLPESSKKHAVNYKFHLPIIALLIISYFSLQTIRVQYYKIFVLGRLQKSSQVDGVYAHGKYRPLSDRGVPAEYVFVKVVKDGPKMVESYYELYGRVTIALYENGQWLNTGYRSYNRDYQVIAPVAGFLLLFVASLSRSVRVLLKGKSSRYIWNKNDYWTYAFTKAERLALLYGLPLFVAGFLVKF